IVDDCKYVCACVPRLLRSAADHLRRQGTCGRSEVGWRAEWVLLAFYRNLSVPGRGMDLKGRTALVTGASQGIGRACALMLAEAGADVALGARTLSKLECVAKEVQDCGRKALAVPLDVADRQSI